MDVITASSSRPPTCLKKIEILSRISHKWSLLIIMELAGGPRRFSELKRAMDGVSQRMLTLTLRDLERDGFIKRIVTPSIPPRVDYELTEMGRSLAGPVQALSDWATQHLTQINSAQLQYEQVSS
ncbi:helix-turn-helix transcriptional regulator [Sphingobium phenoxybenzoativorans]|uniref:Helix-turn-helix transcriptional regulator n=1 Tax=Sphingobium phenoxybenzoativorans TaxID=1592790 RepID=A0A975K8S9_9SPHN|nr:helix-turn-helix domain-containing protein [Sphingobium phenoxybenzoativorans]QUT05542.1 helix-turn-helix transcriptional regulator [Sphingobium phenoxybenzoativorans]